jgi:hypothetical protein
MNCLFFFFFRIKQVQILIYNHLLTYITRKLKKYYRHVFFCPKENGGEMHDEATNYWSTKKRKKRNTRLCIRILLLSNSKGKKSNQAVAACLEKEDVRICGWWHWWHGLESCCLLSLTCSYWGTFLNNSIFIQAPSSCFICVCNYYFL